MKEKAPATTKNYWLLKSEPHTFSLDDLVKAPRQVTPWEGVRNYQARNFLKEMAVGDLAFFYHSSCPQPAIVGIVQIVRAFYPDLTALDKDSLYYDAKSIKGSRWVCVDVKLKQKLPHPITLTSLKKLSPLKNFTLLQKGNRLSVMPVTTTQWEIILSSIKNAKDAS